ncbi:MAG: S1 RNA-binding domain-containing protein, partial [Bdellovibrionales bacterium]|nr:S1 RNA-binding domain-containing protein [Bdellovibrionales bacterium]
IKQLTPDIWESVPHRYPTGARVKGTVTSITDFGVFMELEEGVEGLIHVSQLGLQRGENLKDRFKVGDEVEAEVINVDRNERRISLSMKGARRRREKEEYAQYLEDTSSAVTFGDLLQQQVGGAGDDDK